MLCVNLSVFVSSCCHRLNPQKQKLGWISFTEYKEMERLTNPKLRTADAQLHNCAVTQLRVRQVQPKVTAHSQMVLLYSVQYYRSSL